MSADSPRRSSRGIAVPAIVPPQLVSDRSILDSAIGFINDVTLANQPHTDPKDTITWARFETAADISDPRYGDDWEMDGNVAPPLLLILGYGLGVQVWAIPANGEAVEVLSWRHGIVSALRVLPTPLSSPTIDIHGRADEATDAYADKRPLIAMVDGSAANAGAQPQFCSVNFVSLKTGTQVKAIKFKNPVLDILANRSSIVITFHERIAVFDARTLDDRLSITTCFPSPGINPNPVALGPRWLAYAEQRLLHSKRSAGGCDGDGVASYTATVLNAAKSFGKGLRELGEQVAAGLTGSSAISGSNSKNSSFDSGFNPDGKQPGIITIMDIKNPLKDYSPTSGLPTHGAGSDPTIAHFIAHSEAIVALEFDNSGMLLLTADRRGHDFHIFRIQPHPVGSSLAAVHHLYVLHRGDTSSKVQNIVFSLDTRWVAVSTLRGTTHVFPITPYGGPMGVRTHTSLHVVNKLSRFHRSAGLSADGRSSSPISHSESTTFVQALQPYHNTTLPPFPRPTVVLPLAQLRQPFVLGSPPGSAGLNVSGGGGGKSISGISGSNSQRQRLSSLSDDSGKPLSVCAIFAKSRSWLLEPPNATREAPHRIQKKAVDSLFVMAGHGALIQYDLDTKLSSNVAKEKICDDTSIELEVEAKAQWNLGRRKEGSQEMMPPLSLDNWLIKDRNSCMLTDSTRHFDESDDRAESWLAQVEIITHAGPHRRLWMGPQFVFKTYNTPSGSNLNHVDAEAVEIGVTKPATNAGGGCAAITRVERSSPLNMPLSATARSTVPVLIESGSYSSIEQSPKLMDRFRHDHLDSDFAVAHGDTRLKEDLADAMRESPSVSAAHKHMGRLPSDAASSDNVPFYDALTEHDNEDDDQTFDSHRSSSSVAALASALPNIYSYETSSSYESLDSQKKAKVSIAKVVNPLGTVTTVTAGMTSDVNTDILDEVVSQLAAEDCVIHENCDESLFRPVVAIFCDERARELLGEEEVRKEQEYCKPPELIGNNLIVPVIEKAVDAELIKKEKEKTGVKAKLQKKAQQNLQEAAYRKFEELSNLNKKSKGYCDKLNIQENRKDHSNKTHIKNEREEEKSVKTESDPKTQLDDMVEKEKTVKSISDSKTSTEICRGKEKTKVVSKVDEKCSEKEDNIESDEKSNLVMEIAKSVLVEGNFKNSSKNLSTIKVKSNDRDLKMKSSVEDISSKIEESLELIVKEDKKVLPKKLPIKVEEKIQLKEWDNDDGKRTELPENIPGLEENSKKLTADINKDKDKTKEKISDLEKESKVKEDKAVKKESTNVIKTKPSDSDVGNIPSKVGMAKKDDLYVSDLVESFINTKEKDKENKTMVNEDQTKDEIIKQKPIEPIAINMTPKQRKKNKSGKNKSGSNSESDEVIEVITTKGKKSKRKSVEREIEQKQEKSQLKRNSSISSDDSYTDLAESLLESKSTKEQTMYVSWSDKDQESNIEIEKLKEDSPPLIKASNKKEKASITLEGAISKKLEILPSDKALTKGETSKSEGVALSIKDLTKGEPSGSEDIMKNVEKNDSIKETTGKSTENVVHKEKYPWSPKKKPISCDQGKQAIKENNKKEEEKEKTDVKFANLEESNKTEQPKSDNKTRTEQVKDVIDVKLKSAEAVEFQKSTETKVQEKSRTTKTEISQGAIKKDPNKKETPAITRPTKLIPIKSSVNHPKTTVFDESKLEIKTNKLDSTVSTAKSPKKKIVPDVTKTDLVLIPASTVTVSTSVNIDDNKSTKGMENLEAKLEEVKVITEQPTRTKRADEKYIKRSKASNSKSSSVEDVTEIVEESVKDDLFKFQQTSPKADSGSRKKLDEQLAAQAPLASVWKTVSGAEMINKSLESSNKISDQKYPSLGGKAIKNQRNAKPMLPDIEKKPVESNVKLLPDIPTPVKSPPDFKEPPAIVEDKKRSKKIPSIGFDDFPLLKPLESLSPLPDLEPFELSPGVINKAKTIGDTKPLKHSLAEHVSLINFESPLQENPALERKITPPPRGFTEQNLIFALCGSLHYENESTKSSSISDKAENISPKLSSNMAEQSTAEYKSLIENDEQYLSLEQSSQETNTTNTATTNDKLSSSSQNSSASEEIIVLEEKKTTRKLRRKKQIEMQTKQNQNEQQQPVNDEDVDEELRPLIGMSDSVQYNLIDTKSAGKHFTIAASTCTRSSLLLDESYSAKPTRIAASSSAPNYSTTTDSEGPMPATTSDDNIFTLPPNLSNAQHKLKTKKMEHKINLIAAIEAATSSSTSSAEESGVEAGGRASSDLDVAIVSVMDQSAHALPQSGIIAAAVQQSATKKKTKRRKR